MSLEFSMNSTTSLRCVMISELPKDNNRLYNISMNRFDLEEAMSALYNLGDDIDIILHAYMDAKVSPTEDEMANMLIGVKALHQARYQKMWQTFEELIKHKVIRDEDVPTAKELVS